MPPYDEKGAGIVKEIVVIKDYPPELSPPPHRSGRYRLPVRDRVAHAARRVHCLYYVRHRRKLKGHSANYWCHQARF